MSLRKAKPITNVRTKYERILLLGNLHWYGSICVWCGESVTAHALEGKLTWCHRLGFKYCTQKKESGSS